MKDFVAIDLAGVVQIKPIVHYRPSNDDFVAEGARALLWDVLDHPNQYMVSNTPGTPVMTSEVVEVYGHKAGFETLNTVYIPKKGAADEVTNAYPQGVGKAGPGKQGRN